ncbi:MAG TPA: hypothetical protein VGR32_06865 [Brevundimonas sp.]|jgi:hypothetical protein|uniref:hypothetical protein n=1 Tax=Brevundimonas sp. TaxID=1871086 RepID=UPI002DE5D546|nr:hypothetical protein [Brevundimonas sp.]
MELFGRTLGAQEIAGLVFLLGALALWANVLRGQLRERRWVKERQAEAAKDKPKGPDHGGPWG